jgi:hypothetical protein
VRYNAVVKEGAGGGGIAEEEEEEEYGEDGGPRPPAWSKEVTDGRVVSVPVDTPIADAAAAVWYVPNFLDEKNARVVKEGCGKLRKKFKGDHSFAVGRLSAMAGEAALTGRGKGSGKGERSEGRGRCNTRPLFVHSKKHSLPLSISRVHPPADATTRTQPHPSINTESSSISTCIHNDASVVQ